MENPATWGELEHTIRDALRKAAEARAMNVIGLSEVRIIADALREKGLVVSDDQRARQQAAMNAMGFAAAEAARMTDTRQGAV